MDSSEEATAPRRVWRATLVAKQTLKFTFRGPIEEEVFLEKLFDGELPSHESELEDETVYDVIEVF